MGEVPAEGGEIPVGMETLRGNSRVAILDAGAQYVDLIQKACVRLGFDADILPLDTPFAEIEDKYGAFLLSGGPASTHSEGSPMPDPALWQTEKGVLGICYGQQAMAQAFGGQVETGLARQDGSVKTEVNPDHPLFSRTKKEIVALFTHGDFVTKVPEGFEVIGEHELSDGQQVVSAMAKDNFAAVQFHPEVFDETPHGYDIFQGFLEDMCKLKPDTEMLEARAASDYEDRKRAIAEKASERHVIAFASGGVDSTIATLLAAEVIEPSKIHIYYFDNGFMRDEDNDVIEQLRSIGIDIQPIDATYQFENATITLEDGSISPPLIDVTDPKLKREISGATFAKLKDQIAASLGFDTTEVMLLQGTNAADRIESGYSLAGGKVTEQIKLHHNQVKGIKDMEVAGLLIEPLNDLHKDEIRRIGEHMRLPDDIVWRQPFPGPGLAIRILCYRLGEYEQPSYQLEGWAKNYVDKVVQEISPGTSMNARLLPTRSVGVGGDSRSYVLPVALEGPRDWDTLIALSQGDKSIPSNSGKTINRVVYALGEGSLDFMDMTETTLGLEERVQLRHADHIVFEEMRRFGLMRQISQLPVVLLPLSFDGRGKRSIVLRPVTTSTYLTAKAMVPGRDVDPEFIEQAAKRILSEVPYISQVFLELTNKPPATTEWE